MKHIRQIIIEGLRFYFDIDPSVCHHSFTTAYIIAGLVKLYFSRVTFVLQERVADIREDIIALKTQMLFLNERRNQIR